jgi:Plant transposon protein
VKKGQTAKVKAYTKAQESVRKDVERAFGVLVARFHILARPCNFWYREDVADIMISCIILHNMAVEDRRDGYQSELLELANTDEARFHVDGKQLVWESSNMVPETALTGTWAEMVAKRHADSQSKVDHFTLRNDPTEHIWNLQGSDEA